MLIMLIALAALPSLILSPPLDLSTRKIINISPPSPRLFAPATADEADKAMQHSPHTRLIYDVNPSDVPAAVSGCPLCILAYARRT